MAQATPNLRVFKTPNGTYRWQMVDDEGRGSAVRPGRIYVTGLSGPRRKKVEAALDRVLARVAQGEQGELAKAS